MEILRTDEFDAWFRKLRDSVAKAKINARLRRIELNGELVGDCKPVGDKIIEMRFDVGPGYRVYAHQKGRVLLLLLVGGDKSTQRADIEKARELLREWSVNHE